MVRFAAAFVAALTASVAAAASSTTCGSGTKCPSDKPCCSQYGECGTGAYCLGGCDPINSNSLDACTPEPVCESKTFNDWSNLAGVESNDKYLGNATESDWVSSGKPLVHNGELLLTMAKGSVGTLLAYNHYIWYGKVSAKLKTSRTAGVVTAFILLSDVKDEIDYEFVGTELTTAQTNFYFQGILDWENSVNATTTDTFENYHTYEIDWTPDDITWSLDGKSVRVLKKADTYNETTQQYKFPQTPSRLQLSLWPAGLSTNAPGTIAWAGGEISWDTADIKDPGYYYATFAEVSVTCYDPPSGANIKGDQAYIYTDDAGTNNTVEIVNANTVLGSFEATGLNMTLGATTSTSSSTSTGTGTGTGTGTSTATSASTSVADSVPGSSSGGSGGQSSSGGSSDSGSDSSDGSSTSSGSSPASTGFSQGGDSPKTGAASANEHMLQGSMFAVLVAVVALIAM